MISDALLDPVPRIREYRQDYPFYDTNEAVAAWLDAITRELETLASVVGKPPPKDNRTHRGECRQCHEITTIRLDTLSCGTCRETNEDLLAQLVEVVDGLPERDTQETAAIADAVMAAEHAEELNKSVATLLAWLRQLSRADRDHVLAAIDRGLLEAR